MKFVGLQLCVSADRTYFDAWSLIEKNGLFEKLGLFLNREPLFARVTGVEQTDDNQSNCASTDGACRGSYWGRFCFAGASS